MIPLRISYRFVVSVPSGKRSLPFFTEGWNCFGGAGGDDSDDDSSVSLE
jgi:hypothetical protein